MTLLEIQGNFRAWLRHGQAEAARRFSLCAQQGLAVYQNNYRAQLSACLEQAFPHTRQWIGDAAFDEAAATHINQSPPFYWTLDAYPNNFPDTLRTLYPDDREVSELAALELSLDQAFVAGDAAPIDPALLASIDWDQARLKLTPSLSIHRSESNAGEIWTALRNERVPPAASALSRPSWLLAWRIGERAHFRLAEAAEGDSLIELRNGERFGRMCETLATIHGEARATELAAKWLSQWLADELVVGV